MVIVAGRSTRSLAVFMYRPVAVPNSEAELAVMQETVRLMLEKGAPVTPEIITALKSKDRARTGVDPFGYLAWGLILTAVASD